MPFVKGDKYKSFILGEDTETFGPGKKMEIPSPEDFYKSLEREFFRCHGDLWKGYKKLCAYDASENKNSFCGNNVVYQYYWEGLLATRYKGGKTLMETYKADPQKYWERVCKMDRRKGKPPSVRDAYELNKAITFFKPTTAKFLVQKYTEPGAIVFDPCAGWGGRILGTLSAGRRYTGCDTNPKVKEYAEKMVQDLRDGGNHLPEGQVFNMSCLDYPVCLKTDQNEGGSFDFAFTSPPYGNLEVYEGMGIFTDDDDYYKNFLIPMINRCRQLVKAGGSVAINVSPTIYDKLIHNYDYPECLEIIDFLQQLGQKSGKKKDFVYVWRSTN